MESAANQTRVEKYSFSYWNFRKHKFIKLEKPKELRFVTHVTILQFLWGLQRLWCFTRNHRQLLSGKLSRTAQHLPKTSVFCLQRNQSNLLAGGNFVELSPMRNLDCLMFPVKPQSVLLRSAKRVSFSLKKHFPKFPTTQIKR